MSLKDFVVETIMLCINRFNENIPTQQKKSVEKERFYNIWNWEDRVESGKAKLSLQTLNSSKVYFERARSEVSPAINTTCDILQQESRLSKM